MRWQITLILVDNMLYFSQVLAKSNGLKFNDLLSGKIAIFLKDIIKNDKFWYSIKYVSLKTNLRFSKSFLSCKT